MRRRRGRKSRGPDSIKASAGITGLVGSAALLDIVAWRRSWRIVGGLLIGSVCGGITSALIASMTAQPNSWLIALTACVLGATIGCWSARPDDPRRRRIALGVGLALGGALFGWEMERVPGALIGALAGAPVGWLLTWMLERLLDRVSVRWLCVGFWALLAAILTSAALAIVLRLVTGRLDAGDIAFHMMAIVAMWYWAAATGWLTEPRADLAALRDQMRKVGARFVRSPALPLGVAVVVAGTIAGPAYARYLIDETPVTLLIRRDIVFLLWPGAVAAAAVWTAWRYRHSPQRRGMFIVLAAGVIGCAYGAYSIATYRIEVDAHRLLLHGRMLARADLVRIDFERKTGRRFVGYQPVLALTDGRHVKLDLSTGGSTTARFLQQSWGVPAAERK